MRERIIRALISFVVVGIGATLIGFGISHILGVIFGQPMPPDLVMAIVLINTLMITIDSFKKN